jgi:hypothetical protein
MGIGGSFPGQETDRSLPASAKVENEWSSTPPPKHITDVMFNEAPDLSWLGYGHEGFLCGLRIYFEHLHCFRMWYIILRNILK